MFVKNKNTTQTVLTGKDSRDNKSLSKDPPDLSFTYPLIFPEEMNIIYSILLLFSRYPLLYVQFLPPASKHSQVNAALLFSGEAG